MRVSVALFLAVLWVVKGSAQEDKGSRVTVVLPVKGWSFEGRPIAEKDTLRRSADLIESGSEASDLVLDCGKDGWLSYYCEKPCHVAACAAGNGKRVDPVTRGGSSIVGLFASLVKREPTPLAVLGVRAGGNLTDAVVRQTGTEVHLAPALNRVLEGRYCFRFTPLPPGNPDATRTVTMDWDRSAESEGIVSIPNFRPGLYVLEKSTPGDSGNCVFDIDAVKAWALVTSDADFSGIEPQWKDYTAQLREIERSGASPGILLTVRHAILAHLADSIEEK